MYETIPQELKSLPNWICWQATPDEKSHSGVKKTPINPRTGGNAQSNNPSTWADFDTALQASSKFTGLGFMFSNSGFFGVDIDNMPDDLQDYRNGGVNNVISEFVNTLQSYAELSQSETGIHIICKGALPKGGRRKKNVEMYDTGRFFVMTGKYCSKYAEIVDCTESIKPLHEKYIGGGKLPQAKIQNTVNILATVSDVINLASNAKNGNLFRTLYSGNTAGYNSNSEADMAFCNMLAFWTGCDADKMDAIFRSSGLMREKWDRKQSGSTYGAITLQKAIADCNNIYSPKTGDNYSLSIKPAATPTSSDETTQKTYTFDDMGNAQRFVDLFGSEVRYSYTEKKWMYYDSRKWCVDNTGVIESLADRSILAMKAEANVYALADQESGGNILKAFEKHQKNSRSNKSKKSMLSETMHHIPILPAQLDRFKMALNTPSGVINLKNGDLKSHAAEHYFTKITSVDYSVNADCPRWIAFLKDIFNNDLNLIRYIQKAVGYSLTGSTAEQCAFFLFGTGRNGKSTFLDVIRQVFGDYATNIQPETIMIRPTSGSSINSDIARLKGARLVTSVEPNEGVRINEGLLKQLTGDDVVTARKLYAEEFEFKPEFKLWMATNHKPIIRGTDTGIWRRIHMIPFTVQIPEDKVDRNLPHKLKAEMTAIFKWCVDGCLLYQQEGLKMPKAIMDCVRDYRREMDIISAFIEDRCEVGAGLSVQSAQLHAAYMSWAEQGNEYCMSNTKFGIEIAKRYEKIKSKKCNYYLGLTLDGQV